MSRKKEQKNRGGKIIKEITEFSKVEENKFTDQKGTVSSTRYDESRKHLSSSLKTSEKQLPAKERELD